MYRIDLRRVRMVEAGLSEKEAVLKSIAADLEKIETRMKEMTLGEEVCMQMAKIRESIDEDRTALHQMAVCLEDVREICRKSEQSIVDRYDLEYIAYPETTFGISHITGLEPYESLLVFSDN